MAPALTQTAEPPNLVDATCHAPDSNTSTGSLYENLKELGRAKTSHSSGKSFFESEQILISNGDCAPSGLAPPAFGWAEGRPVPDSSPCRSNMDEHPPPLPLSDSGDVCISSQQQTHPNPPVSSNSSMGLQSCITNVDAASTLVEKSIPAAPPTTITTPVAHPQDDSSTALNQNELLALVGRDFDDVNDIIDTLKRLASNPELLDAAARDLEPEPAAASTATAASAQSVPHQRQSPEDRAALLLKRLNERQRQLERRRLFLLRRLRRATARGLGMTVSSQLNHLTRHVRAVVEGERAKQPLEKRPVEEPIGLEMLHKESMKAMSTSDLISLVRRVEASNNLQRLNDSVAKKNEVKEAVQLPSSLCAQLDTVASEMRAAAVAHVAHDSDATESSSGGESCDEDEVYSSINTNYKPIRQRAFYRYCRMRGWVASKWMWLQAEIAGLEYKILQQQKLHARIQKSKGAVQLAAESSSVKSRPPQRSPAHLDMQDPALTCIGTVTPRTVLNGYHPANKAEEGGIPGLVGSGFGADALSGGGCARTLGVEKVKRRRYVRPSVVLLKRGLGGSPNSTNLVNRVSSPVLCKCIPPLSCILCCIKSRTSGKNNGISFGNSVLNPNKLGAIAFLNQSVSDKVSKVDLSFHPVLSRHSEMLQGELYSRVLRSAEWQQKALLSKPLAPREGTTSSSISHFEPLAKRKKDKEHKRNGRRKHLREEAKDKITLKIRKSLVTEALEQDREAREKRKRKIETRNSSVNNRRSVTEDDADEGDDELGGWHVSVGGSAQSSPCPSPALIDKVEKVDGRSMRKHSTTGRQKQNSTSNSYDINNIVIPYSMAATSRVELLQYKEIPTPKWRVQEIAPLPLSPMNNNNEEEEEEEDISDEAVLSRHKKSEEMERKKFLTYLQTQVNSSRSSRSRRADSSGTNTPDHPLSPRQLEPMETSPIGSPPDTPLLAPSEDSNHSSSHASSKSTNQSTVLTLSLSSLQSSLLKSNPPPTPLDAEENASSSLRSYQKSSISSGGMIDVPVGLRTRRLLSGGVQFDRVRSIAPEEQSEKDRLSPFPCRKFPLNENEYQDLVCESQSKNGYPLRTSLRNNSNSISSSVIPAHRGLDEDAMELTGTDVESGRDSPLSELTDSAPEEEGSWDDGGSPDWTISVVSDHCGGVVLTVQRN